MRDEVIQALKDRSAAMTVSAEMLWEAYRELLPAAITRHARLWLERKEALEGLRRESIAALDRVKELLAAAPVDYEALTAARKRREELHARFSTEEAALNDPDLDTVTMTRLAGEGDEDGGFLARIVRFLGLSGARKDAPELDLLPAVLAALDITPERHAEHVRAVIRYARYEVRFSALPALHSKVDELARLRDEAADRKEAAHRQMNEFSLQHTAAANAAVSCEMAEIEAGRLRRRFPELWGAAG